MDFPKSVPGVGLVNGSLSTKMNRLDSKDR